MKKLFLLRHAHAPAAADLSDFNRPLSQGGMHQARMLGQQMQRKGYRPDFIYCSPATRTRQTLDGLFETLDSCTTHSPRLIYDGGRGELYHLIQQTPDSANAVMVIAHNPGIHGLAVMLAQDSGQLFTDLHSGYQPATLSVLDCDLKDWGQIKPGENKLLDLIFAEKH